MTLEALAGKVIAQLARRNILVVDVEIYEFTKKKISFKEASDGILIKNRKFSFDDGAVVGGPVVESESEEESPPPQKVCAAQPTLPQNDLLAQLLANPAVLAALGAANGQGAVVPAAPKKAPPPGVPSPLPNKILRYEIFNPVDKIFLEDSRRRKLAFTLGKRYPILSERMAANSQVGMFYHTIDDKGQRQVMCDKFFTPEAGKLEGFEDQVDELKVAGRRGDGLDWSAFTDEYDSKPVDVYRG